MRVDSAAPLTATGVSGFIGSHLAAELEKRGREFLGIDRLLPGSAIRQFTRADIRNSDELTPRAHRSGVLIHLAAEAEVITPWEKIPDALGTNLNGTWNLLDAFTPRLCVFASSSSVYGSAIELAPPAWHRHAPVGLYGSTKYSGEILLRDWAAEKRRSAVLFRFGNVIGRGCRGLIPYLVRHAKAHPGGAVPASMRGGGKLVRDYVPVGFVVRMLLAAADAAWPEGATEIFNVGCGSGMTNGEVAEFVRCCLRRRGLDLTFDFDHPVPPGEAHSIVLDVKSLVSRFGVTPPSRPELEAAMEESVDEALRV